MKDVHREGGERLSLSRDHERPATFLQPDEHGLLLAEK